MCANDNQHNTATDDVWDSSDSGNDEAGTPGSPPRSHLDREWEARKQQFYNVRLRFVASCVATYAPAIDCTIHISLHPAPNCHHPPVCPTVTTGWL